MRIRSATPKLSTARTTAEEADTITLVDHGLLIHITLFFFKTIFYPSLESKNSLSSCQITPVSH